MVFAAEVILAGFLVGVLVGMTGVGGGALMAPVLLLLFKLNPLIVVGTDLFYNAPTKIVGAIAHARQGTLDRPVAVNLACGGIAGVLFAVAGLQYVGRHAGFDGLAALARHWIGLAICLSAILTVLPIFWRNALENQPERAPHRGMLVGLGALVGAIVTATSVGAGAITMPLLCLMLRRSKIATLVGSDLAFSAVIAAAGAVFYFSAGLIALKIGLLLLVGSTAGVLLGSRLSFRIGDLYLRPVVGAMLFFVGARLYLTA
jgi:uncharacterized membrane protein YfcA